VGLLGALFACTLAVALAWIGGKAAGEPLSLTSKPDSGEGRSAAALWAFCFVAAAGAASGVLPAGVGTGTGSLAIGGFLMARTLAGSRPGKAALGMTVLVMALPAAVALSAGAYSQEHLSGSQAVIGPLALWDSASGWVARGALLAGLVAVPVWVQSLPRLDVPLGSSSIRAFEAAVAALLLSSASFGPSSGAILTGPFDSRSAMAVAGAFGVAAIYVGVVGSLRRLARLFVASV